jgi:hypothetical protein
MLGWGQGAVFREEGRVDSMICRGGSWVECHPDIRKVLRHLPIPPHSGLSLRRRLTGPQRSGRYRQPLLLRKTDSASAASLISGESLCGWNPNPSREEF